MKNWYRYIPLFNRNMKLLLDEIVFEIWKHILFYFISHFLQLHVSLWISQVVVDIDQQQGYLFDGKNKSFLYSKIIVNFYAFLWSIWNSINLLYSWRAFTWFINAIKYLPNQHLCVPRCTKDRSIFIGGGIIVSIIKSH